MRTNLPDATADVLIVGGGIIGLSLAYELVSRGHLVTVVERDTCGRAASWAGVGILPPVAQREIHEPIEQLRTLSHNLLTQWAVRLHNETGIDPGWRECGGLYLATTAAEAATLSANEMWWDEVGIEAFRWTVEQMVQREPHMHTLAHSGAVRGVWWLPGECQLRTPRYVRALATACRQRGVKILEHCPVQALECTSDRAVAVETPRGSLRAEKFCVTAGPWTRQLLEPLGVTTGVLPIRGQIALYRPDQPLLSTIVNEGHRYLVPRIDGRILVGSNEEEVGFRCETTDSVLEQLSQWAFTVLPELRSVVREQVWAGLRPGSFDSYPYIGQLPDRPNLYVAAGHYRAGIHLSCGTASVLADLITTGRCAIDLSPFRPGRG